LIRPACRWIGDNVAVFVLDTDLRVLTAEAAAQEVWVVGADPRDAEGVKRCADIVGHATAGRVCREILAGLRKADFVDRAERDAAKLRNGYLGAGLW
jgi:hypothetical protein